VVTEIKNEKRSVASQLVDMARDSYVLGISDDGLPFGVYPDVAHVAMLLRGGKLGLRAELARRYFEKQDAVPASQALADACTVLEGYASQEVARPLHLRVAAAAGRVYIDMADPPADRVVVIGGGTWDLDTSAPVVFRRTALTSPLPEPQRDGNLELLWDYVNVAERDRAVLLAVLVAALVQPDAPHVILGLLAEHGSAKSTTTRLLVSLIDPSIAPLRMPPRDIDNWATAANGSWVVAVDNMSGVAPWFSDALCRAATGDALPKRRLYTDDDLAVLKFRRCVILNGIDLGGLAGDLSDRLALVDLERITPRCRRDEAELTAAWEQDRPAILGGLLDLCAEVHQRMPDLKLPHGLPRMADFAKVLACIDQLLGTDGLARYLERATRLAADSIASDSFVSELQRQRYAAEQASAAQILEQVTRAAAVTADWRAPRDWPKKARQITGLLTRHAPALRALGWSIEHDNGRNHANVTRWTVVPPEETPESASPDSPDSHSQVNGPKQPRVSRESDARNASYASQDARDARQTDSGDSRGKPATTCTDEVASHASHFSGFPLASSACSGCGSTLRPSNTTGLCAECRLIARNQQTTDRDEETA
jgi:hypothetical protein